jgi:hypothetical protein
VRFACYLGALEQDGHGGAGEGGTGCDQGDLPAGHAAAGDDVDGRLRTVGGAAAVRRQ